MNIVILTSHKPDILLTLEPESDTLYLLEPGSYQVELVLKHSGVRAFVVGLFSTSTEQTLTINQHHVAPKTQSHVLLKSLVKPTGNFFYQGNLLIEQTATETDASQEARGLLLGADARFKAVPALEIYPQEVMCKHKASSTPLNQESLYTLQTKGFSDQEATVILEKAFLFGAQDTLIEWGINPEDSPELQKYFENIVV